MARQVLGGTPLRLQYAAVVVPYGGGQLTALTAQLAAIGRVFCIADHIDKLLPLAAYAQAAASAAIAANRSGLSDGLVASLWRALRLGCLCAHRLTFQRRHGLVGQGQQHLPRLNPDVQFVRAALVGRQRLAVFKIDVPAMQRATDAVAMHKSGG